MFRRKWMLRCMGWGAACMWAFVPLAALSAQPLSDKPIRIVVPFGAGGVADVTARIVAQQLSTQMGQPVVIDNKPSAGGIVAAEAVVKSVADGHTLFLMSNGSAVTVNMFKQLPFDMVKDLKPVSTLGYFDIGVVADASAPFPNLRDVIAFAKSNPGKLNIGSINVGSTQHLAAELFKSTAGVDAQIIPFNGTPAVTTALRGKQIDVAVEILAPITGQIQSNALKLLAVMGQERSVLLPNIPTAQEQGVQGFVASSWNALAVSAKTPDALVQRLNQEIVAAVQHPDVVRKLQLQHVHAKPSSPDAASQLLQTEIQRWGEVIEAAGIPKQ